MSEMERIIATAMKRVKDYFSRLGAEPSKGYIHLAGGLYLLVRTQGLAKVYVRFAKELGRAACNLLLYQLGYNIARDECRQVSSFYGIDSPLEKMVMGPLFFAYIGWGTVEILKANFVQSEDFVLLWEAPQSSYAKTYKEELGEAEHPVCYMLAGYSAGWCSEAFNLPLETREIFCSAAGSERCRFLTAHQTKIRELLEEDWIHKPRSEFKALVIKPA